MIVHDLSAQPKPTPEQLALQKWAKEEKTIISDAARERGDGIEQAPAGPTAPT